MHHAGSGVKLRSRQIGERVVAKWKWLEDVTALSLGCVGVVAGDLGTAAAGIVGGAGLLGAWRETKARHGLESEALHSKGARRCSARI